MNILVRKALGYLAMALAVIGFIAATGTTDSGNPSLWGVFLGGVGAGAMFAAIRFNLLNDGEPELDLWGEPLDVTAPTRAGIDVAGGVGR